MPKVSDDYRMEKAVKKVLDAIAELHRLRHPMWPEQMQALKKAVFDLEERMAEDTGLFHEASNR